MAGLTDPRTRARAMYEGLLDEIYSGRIPPGEKIREKRQGVSQDTVRYALVRLEPLELVDRVEHVGTTVANPTQQDIAHRIAVRIPLEIMACEAARQRLAQRDRLLEAQTLLRQIGETVRGDERFHHFIWDLGDNKLLARTLKKVSAPMFAFIALLRRKGFQDGQDRIRSHQVLLDTLHSSSDEEMRPIVEQHIREAYRSFLMSNIPDMRTLAALPDKDSSSTQLCECPSKHREFLRWVPALASVYSVEGRLLFANEECERFVDKHGLQPRTLSSQVSSIVDEHTGVLTAERRNGIELLRLAFPMWYEGPLIGEFGISIGNLLHETQTHVVSRALIDTIPPSANRASGAGIKPLVLSEFFKALPAVATWKDLQGRLLWANPEFRFVTHKPIEDAVGHSPAENWEGRLGSLIAAHDATVRRTRVPYLTIDSLSFPPDEQHRSTTSRGDARRLTIRFPMFDDSCQLAGTATVGFEYSVLQLAATLLGDFTGDGETHQPWPLRRTSAPAASNIAAI